MTSTFANSMIQRTGRGRFRKREIDSDLLTQLRDDVAAEHARKWHRLAQVATPEVQAYVDSLIHEHCGQWRGDCVCNPHA